ncbi:MAG: TIGR04086 family membrane protein [Clostridia bacterium]|nr:TIGR04086 family membrane protein [Clostridia bacterium]
MQNETTYGNGLFQIIKGVALALALSFLGVVALANALRFFSLSETAVYPINQLIKCVSIAIGSLAFIRGEKGFLKGGGAGVLFTFLSYLAFSALGGDFSLSWLILIELLFTVLIGAIGGAVAVNLRRR